MIEKTASAPLSSQKVTTRLAAISAIMLGLIIIAGTGFVQAHALHEGTHDTRHAFGLPCH